MIDHGRLRLERPMRHDPMNERHSLAEAIEIIGAIPTAMLGGVNTFHRMEAPSGPIVTLCPTTALLLAWFPHQPPWSHHSGYTWTVDACLGKAQGYTEANIVGVYDAAGGYERGRRAVIANLKRGGDYELDL